MARRRKGSAAACWAADPWLDPRLLTRAFGVFTYVADVPADVSTVIVGDNPDRWLIRLQTYTYDGLINFPWVIDVGAAQEDIGQQLGLGVVLEYTAYDRPALVGRAWSAFCVAAAAVLVTEVVRLPGGPTPPPAGTTVHPENPVTET